MVSEEGAGQMGLRFVTREKIHVDRVACPWLIKRFIVYAAWRPLPSGMARKRRSLADVRPYRE
jgi:hypothetical protein